MHPLSHAVRWCIPLFFVISWSSLDAQPASLASQYLKATPVLLTDAEASALMSRHTDATKPSTKRHKHTRKVVEMTTPMGHVVRTEVFSTSPNKILAIITMPGWGTQKSGWDGKVGWSLTPHVGAALLDSAAVEKLKALSQLGPASPIPTGIAPTSKWYSAGQDTLDGRAMLVILTVLSGGDSAITYFDAQTGLMAGMRAIRHAGQPGDSSAFMLFGDYKRIDGAMLPMKHTVFVRDQQIVTRTVEYDHKRIDPARFALPPAIRGLIAYNSKRLP